MTVALHWFLPTNGDSRSDLALGNAVGVASGRDPRASARAPDIGYLAQIARAAEALGFVGALTPTSSWCEDAWIATAALTQQTTTFKYLVAFRPGVVGPTIAAQMAATYQRISGGRLLLNVVVGGDDEEQRRFGDYVAKDDRYARAGEFLEVFRRLWDGEAVTFDGDHVTVTDAQVVADERRPDIYLGGSSDPALAVAARHADVYLTWGEPPAQVAEKIERVRALAAGAGRELRYGIRLHVIARETAAEAWAEADRLLTGMSATQIARAQEIQRTSRSVGQARMSALHGGRTDALEVSPNLWAGVGLVRGGAGTALVGSYADVADRIAEYHASGIDEFILSGYPHLEEAYRVGEGVMPELRRRGVLRDPPALRGDGPVRGGDVHEDPLQLADGQGLHP